MSRISIIIKCCKYKTVCWHGRPSRKTITEVAWVCFRRKTVQSSALNHWGLEKKTIHSSGTAMLQCFRRCGGFEDWILLAPCVTHLWQHITPLAGPSSPHSCPAVPEAVPGTVSRAQELLGCYSSFMVSSKRQKELEKKHTECLLCGLHMDMSKLARQESAPFWESWFLQFWGHTSARAGPSEWHWCSALWPRGKQSPTAWMQ